MRKICLSVIAIAFSISSFTQNVPFDVAEKIAGNFLQYQTSQSIQKSNSFVLQNSHTEINQGKTLYHIFNYQNGGFVIVSGNYQSSPVLAYSTESQIDFSDMNPALKMWLEAQNSHSNAENMETEAVKKQWDDLYNNSLSIRKSGSKVGPFTTSTWNQDRYYNAYCPEDINVTGEIGGNYDNHVPNGCVAVAMSQIMYYHRYPTTGFGSFSYVSPYGRLTANFANAFYDYNAMSDVATGYSDALALLISHCGISVEMGYAADGSGTQTEKARMSMIGYFGYSTTSRFERKEMYNDSVWQSKIVQSLDSKLPIIYSGRKEDADAGHAWLCDGYEIITDTTSWLHFNWGWGFSGGNGWFLSTTKDGYIIGESAIFGLTPKVDLADCSQDTLTATYGSFYSGSPIKDYANNADCSWLISTPNATSIKLTAAAFATEADNDVVTVYAGNSTSDSIVWVLSGDTLTPGSFITINASEALITFTSNASITNRGFVFTYTTTLSNPGYCNTNLDPGTGNVLSAVSGTLTNGSGNENYVNSNTCYWRIEPTGATGVWIDVTDFNLAKGDELSIYAHSGKYIQAIKFPDRIAKYTIDNPPTGVLTSSDKNRIYITFRSDNDKNDKGWTLKWGIDVGICDKDAGISSLRIYPNPATETVNIDLTTEESIGEIKMNITDMTGRNILSTDINNNNRQIDVSNFAKGVYILSLHTYKGSIKRKIVVQ